VCGRAVRRGVPSARVIVASGRDRSPVGAWCRRDQGRAGMRRRWVDEGRRGTAASMLPVGVAEEAARVGKKMRRHGPNGLEDGFTIYLPEDI
jgi:hypothetical protein